MAACHGGKDELNLVNAEAQNLRDKVKDLESQIWKVSGDGYLLVMFSYPLLLLTAPELFLIKKRTS